MTEIEALEIIKNKNTFVNSDEQDLKIIICEALENQIRNNCNNNPKEWHLVADGDLPSDKREVLCTDIYGDYFVGWYKGYWTDGECDNIKVEAWMELPKFDGVE